MKRNVPMLSQVLHFLDFNLTARHIAYWRDKPMRERYKEVGASYGAPIFLDSGGFKLLYNAGLDLSQYGIRKDKEAEDILEFQLNLGGEILASLDYPLPPNLARDEAENRMKRSIDNATRVAEILADKPNPPFLYICCHGQSREDVRNYVYSDRIPMRKKKDYVTRNQFIRCIKSHAMDLKSSKHSSE